MITQKRIYIFLSFTLLFVISTVTIAAQPSQATPQELNLEAVLHVLASSDQGASGENLPATLSAVSRQLRGELGVTNLRLVNAYFGRMSSLGALEYKGVSDSYLPNPIPGSPSFVSWQLVALNTRQNTAVQDTFQFLTFNFGARVPVRVGSVLDESKPAPINDEQIGLRTDRISVKENVPTLVGTLTQPKTNGTLFLVLTVRNVDK